MTIHLINLSSDSVYSGSKPCQNCFFSLVMHRHQAAIRSHLHSLGSLTTRVEKAAWPCQPHSQLFQPTDQSISRRFARGGMDEAVAPSTAEKTIEVEDRHSLAASDSRAYEPDPLSAIVASGPLQRYCIFLVLWLAGRQLAPIRNIQSIAFHLDVDSEAEPTVWPSPS